MPRCAASVRFRGLVVSCVHLCGGRFDDRDYARLLDAKYDALRRLVEGVRPDVIVGDFNAERSDARMRRSLQGYPWYRSLAASERARFRRYYRACHRYLEEIGEYEPAYDDADPAFRTSELSGGVPDWVYVRRGLRPRVRGVRVLPAFPRLSDHHAVLVDLECDGRGQPATHHRARRAPRPRSES